MMFSFLYPLGFLLALGIPALVWIYLRKSREEEIAVSSTFLLEKLSKRPVISKKAEFPLRFFLELLAICALFLAAAEPKWSMQREHLALILDNSLSMNARTNSAETAATRFEAAKEEARLKTTGLKTGADVSLFALSKTLEKINQQPLAAAQAERALQDLQPSTNADNLLQLLSAGGNWCEFDRAVLITDHAFLQHDAQLDLSHSVPLEIIKVGTPVPNLALEHAKLLTENDTQNLAAELIAYGGTPVEAELKLSDGNGQTLSSEHLSLTPRERKQIRLPLTQAGTFRAEIFPRSKKLDALDADNFAVIHTNADTAKKILVVSADDTGLSKLALLSAVELSPQSYETLAPAERDKYALTVFHRYLPENLPQTPLLVVLPPEEHPLYGARQLTNQAEITSADTAHPLTAYLQTAALSAPSALVFSTPNWGQAVINTGAGAVLIAGDYQGRRTAVSGLEIFPFEGRKTPAGTVLTLNLFSWLLGNEGLAADFERGEESNTFAANTLELPSRLTCSEESLKKTDHGFWPWFILATLLCLFAEWAVRSLKRKA